MKPGRKVGQGKKRSHDRAFNDTRLVPDISNWPSSLSTSSSDHYTLSPSSPGDSDNSQPDHWDITLDRDLYETIITLYPEWFGQHMAEEVPQVAMMGSPGSPRSVVDEASIQQSMERNKESLKVKLLLRRPISQLVEQGILPPLKASPVFYEQSKKLERARMEDFLKHKIQRRPDRQALIEQHILEDTSICPGLQDKQRQLKKARLADDLNDRLSHRPGPLELIKGNILVADERVAQAIKEGAIHFKATCEGEPVKHPPPLFHLEDPETSSDGTRSPQDLSPPILGPSIPANGEFGTAPNPLLQPPTASTSSTAPGSSPSAIQISPLQLTNLLPITSTPSTAASSTSTSSSSGVVTLTTFNASASSSTPSGNEIQNVPQFKPIFTPGTSTPSSKSDSSKQRKKPKSKVQPKTRTIKFHEYKGPPNAQKNSELSTTSQIESSYELMLKQQQLLLQLELEWQQKMASGIILTSAPNQESSDKISHPTIVLPNSTQPSIQIQTSNKVPNTMVTFETPLPKTIANVPPPPAQTSQPVQPANKMVSKLEDLKVNDLKVQLKKRSLTVSGSKPQLIERLKPYAEEVIASLRALVNESAKCKEEPSSPCSNSGSPMSDQQKMSVPVSPETAPMDVTEDGHKFRKPNSDPMDVNDNYIEIPQSQPQPHPSSSFVSTFGMSEVPPITATPFNNGFIINEDILKLQQKRIEQLQRELENSQQQQLQQQQQFHFQLQHPFSFHPQAQTISIPLTSITGPQFQVISAAAPNPNIVTLRAEPTPPQPQPQPLMNPSPVIRKSSETTKPQNQRRHSNTVNTPSREAISTARKTSSSSASVKASLAAFLHSQQAAATAAAAANSSSASSNCAPEIQSLNQAENGSSGSKSNTKPGRAHSLTVSTTTSSSSSSVSASNVPTRTSSLPTFTERVATEYQRPPPPNYEEAIRTTVKSEIIPRKKDSVKSQAVDDVLEILIKNGELPESAAQEPPTPVEKCSKNVFSSSTSCPSSSPSCNSKDPQFEQRSVVVHVAEEQIVVKDPSSGDMSLDLDFALDLQELADSMDLSDMTHTPDKNCTFWMPDLGLNPSDGAKKNNTSTSVSTSAPSNSSTATTNSHNHNDVSLNELMEAANSVDWFSDLMSNNNNHNHHISSNNQINNYHHRSDDRSREVPSDTYNTRMYSDRGMNQNDVSVSGVFSGPITYDGKAMMVVSNSQSLNSSGSSSCSSSYVAKDHDPLLPNNMLGTSSTADPLIDLFFDENDFKTSHDLSVWDRLDFST